MLLPGYGGCSWGWPGGTAASMLMSIDELDHSDGVKIHIQRTGHSEDTCRMNAGNTQDAPGFDLLVLILKSQTNRLRDQQTEG